MKDISAKNQDLSLQVAALKDILLANGQLVSVLQRIPELALPNWYLGAGCIAQTVWNHAHGFEPSTGIKDYDLVYFDPDTSYEAEDRYIKLGKEVFANSGAEVEIRNQARVHLWHEDHFGYKIAPYRSVEESINTWPTTATGVGIRYQDNNFEVYAPYGLHDLLSLTVRANKVKITKDIYQKKVERWTVVWPHLVIVPWD